MPVEPVPTTATRLPVKSTPSLGHDAVWYQSPSKVSSLLKSGTFFEERQPVAMMQNRAEKLAPSAVSMVQRLADSSNTADFTRVFNWRSLRRSNRSAT